MNKNIEKKISKALDSGKYFITITYLDEENQLRHFYTTKKFYNDDLIPTLDHIKSEVIDRKLKIIT